MSEQEIEKNKRRDKVKHILEALPPLEIVNSLHEADDLPRSSLHGALQRYVEGMESDCIFHAAFSVELALLLRLDKKLTPVEKEAMKQEAIRTKTGLMFGRIINLVTEKAILEEADIKRAWKLNNLRNMHAHPANWIAFIKQQYQAATDVEKCMPDISAMIEDRLASSLEALRGIEEIREALKRMAEAISLFAKRLENLPNLDWCASQDTLGFQAKRARAYYKESYRELLSVDGLLDLISSAQDPAVYARVKYPYAGRDGHEALTCAYEILSNLGVI
jgi:hypothetical protein